MMLNNERQEVPCGACTLCCQGDAVRLLPQDDHGLYITEPHPLAPSEKILAHKDNGDCIYLDREKGCTIHPHRPIMCGTMDCRNIFKSMNENSLKVLIKNGYLNSAIYNRGKELIEAVDVQGCKPARACGAPRGGA